MGLIIDGISASEHLDSSGEILKIDGHDISDLIEGRGVLNWEHNNDSSEDIVGAITYAKKIKKKSDCEDDRQEMFWDACKVPFIYIRAELFDDEEHPGAICAAAMIRYYKKRNLKVLAGFSVEGATLDKDDNVLKRSVGRRVALTLRPCNKSAISDVYEDPKNKDLAKFMQLDKPINGKAYEVQDIIFNDLSKGQQGDWKKEGYSLEYSYDSSSKKHIVHAYDHEGNRVGRLAFIENSNGTLKNAPANMVNVEPAHQRKGIASAMYSYGESKTGKKFVQGMTTPAGSKVWEQKNRPFGKSEHKDKLAGGKADKRKPSDFNAKDLNEGMRHELEHTKDKTIAQEIAMDHLSEDASYYKKLKTIEKNDLFKGQNGDWKKEGYSFTHKDHGHNQHTVYAFDKSGNKAGVYSFSHYPEKKTLYVSESDTESQHQRKGLATAAYKLIENKTKSKVVPLEHQQTEDARYFWGQKNRPFGKSEYQTRNRAFAMEDGLHKTALPEMKPAVHNQKVRDVADSYMKKTGKTMVHNAHQVEVHPEMAKKVADAYHNMKHTPNDPATQKAYGALINETKDQFEHLKGNGFKFSKIQPGQENPYKSSKDLVKDVHENNHAWYFPTESGFGTGTERNDHPLMQKVKTSDGEMHANDLFRVVHDVFGHAKEGNGFGPKGEENAYRHHMQMYSPEAQKALTSETRGQNSWVNFGPHGEQNRKDPANTIYADQKAGLMPEWTTGMWNGLDKSEDPLTELRASIAVLKKTLTAGGGNVAPSQLTGGAALVIEERVNKKKKGLKPEAEKKLKNIIAAWDGKSSLAATIKACLPEVSDNYIDHFANLAEEYTLKKAVNHMEHCDNENATLAQDNLITGINVFAHEGKERFFATNYAGKPVLVVCCEEDKAKRATKFYEFVSTIFPTYSASVPLTNYLKHPSLAHSCAYVQLLPEDHANNTVMNPDYYGFFRKDSWILHGFAVIDMITGAFQDRTELNTLCGHPPLFLGNTDAFYYDNFGGKPFYLKLIGTELLHLEAVKLLEAIEAIDLAVYAKYSLQLNAGEIKTMLKIIEQLKTQYHGKTITQLFNLITDGIKNEA